MTIEDLGAIAIVAAIAAGAFMVATHPASPVQQSAPSAVPHTYASFCQSSHLVPKAVADCQKRMDAATTDAEREKVERIFSMGRQP